MKVLFNQCWDCSLGKSCYESGFERCPKIEKAAEGLCVPYKPKDMSWAENIPFGVYMGLKHILDKSKKMTRSPKVDIDPDMPKMEYPRVDFAKRLSIETPMSQEDASIFVAEISMYGNIKDAIECYNEHGLNALDLYLSGCKAKIRMGVV